MEKSATRKERKPIAVPPVIAWVSLWVLSGVLFWASRSLPFRAEDAPGPGFFPFYLSIGLAILNLFYGIEIFRRPEKAAGPFPAVPELIRPAGFVLMTLFIILLWERLGVIPTVLLASFAEQKFLEGQPWPRSLWVGLAVTGLAWGIFQGILGIPLPQGLLEGIIP